jgi:hypothetical protein
MKPIEIGSHDLGQGLSHVQLWQRKIHIFIDL